MSRRSGPGFRRLSATAYVLAAALAVASLACRPGTPILNTGPRPPTVDGTISGSVRGPEGTSAIVGRTVEAINVDTGERYKETTSTTGGFTFKLKPGKYRVEVTLQPGEAIVKQPDVFDLNKSDVDAHADFVLGSPRS